MEQSIPRPDDKEKLHEILKEANFENKFASSLMIVQIDTGFLEEHQTSGKLDDLARNLLETLEVNGGDDES